MMLLYKIYRRILFEIELKICKYILTRMESNLFIFPIFIDLSLNKKRYLQKYYKNISIKQQIFSKVAVMQVSMNRHIQRDYNTLDKKLLQRHKHILSLKENRQEVEELFGKEAFN